MVLGFALGSNHSIYIYILIYILMKKPKPNLLIPVQFLQQRLPSSGSAKGHQEPHSPEPLE